MSRSKRKTLVSDARAVLARCAGVNVRLAERRVTHFLEAAHERCGSQPRAVRSPRPHRGRAVTTRSRRSPSGAGLDQSTLSRNLRGLEEVGLVEIVVAEQDLRRRAVWLTEAGARRLEGAIASWRAAHAALSRTPARWTLVRQLAAETEALGRWLAPR